MNSDYAPITAIVAGATLGLVIIGLNLNLDSQSKFKKCLAQKISTDQCSLIIYGR